MADYNYTTGKQTWPRHFQVLGWDADLDLDNYIDGRSPHRIGKVTFSKSGYQSVAMPISFQAFADADMYLLMEKMADVVRSHQRKQDDLRAQMGYGPGSVKITAGEIGIKRSISDILMRDEMIDRRTMMENMLGVAKPLSPSEQDARNKAADDRYYKSAEATKEGLTLRDIEKAKQQLIDSGPKIPEYAAFISDLVERDLRNMSVLPPFAESLGPPEPQIGPEADDTGEWAL